MLTPRRASEETVTIRLGALSLSMSSSWFVSRNGARWLTASVSSRPSGVWVRWDWIKPALFDEHIQARVPLPEPLCQSAHLRLRCEVREHERDPLVTRRFPDPPDRRLSTFLAAPGHDELSAHRGE